MGMERPLTGRYYCTFVLSTYPLTYCTGQVSRLSGAPPVKRLSLPCSQAHDKLPSIVDSSPPSKSEISAGCASQRSEPVNALVDQRHLDPKAHRTGQAAYSTLGQKRTDCNVTMAVCAVARERESISRSCGKGKPALGWYWGADIRTHTGSGDLARAPGEIERRARWRRGKNVTRGGRIIPRRHDPLQYHGMALYRISHR